MVKALPKDKEIEDLNRLSDQELFMKYAMEIGETPAQAEGKAYTSGWTMLYTMVKHKLSYNEIEQGVQNAIDTLKLME